MNKLIFLFSITVCFFPGVLLAQEKIVTGTVRDANGPLPGATITEKQEPKNAVAADDRGRFRMVLRGTSGAIVVTHLNYQLREIRINKNNNVDVVMEQSIQGMEEYVVVGFGKKKRI